VLPKYRFPEFIGDNEWNVATLRNITTPIQKRAGANKYMLMSVTSGVGLVPQKEKFGREIAGSAYKNYIVIQRGDFAYNKSATKQFPEGYIAMLIDYDEAALPNSIFTCFRIIDEQVCADFLNHIFQSNYHGSWLRKFIAVSARAHGSLNIDDKHLWEMPVVMPELPEQQRIVDCLSSLDELIAAENKKLETLKTHKKGLMQKLFPAEGKTIPEWRFPEFRSSDEWEEKSLSSLCTMQAGKFVPASDLHEKKKSDMYPCYGGNGMRGYTNSFTHSGEYSLIGRQGALCGNVIYVNEDFHATEHAVVATSKKTIVPKWLYYLLLKLDLNQHATGQAQPGLSVQTLEKIASCAPKDKYEQQKIADCLSDADTLITAQVDKIEALRLCLRSRSVTHIWP